MATSQVLEMPINCSFIFNPRQNFSTFLKIIYYRLTTENMQILNGFQNDCKSKKWKYSFIVHSRQYVLYVISR